MSDDLNTEIKIGADASGVEAGVGRAKRSLATLGDAATKTGSSGRKSIEEIGFGGDKAAKKVESATRSMQNSIQRLIAEQKAGAKGSREYYEALADSKGISRNSLKPLLDQLDAAKSKTLQAKGAADSWHSSLGKMAPMVAAAFSGAALAGFVGKVVSVQREFDVLNSSLKTVTGSSAAAEKEMAWLKDFAKATPFGLAQATQGFVKMKALGLDPTRAALTSFGNTASAMGKDLNQMIEAVADASTGEFERLKEFGIKARKEGDNVSLTFQGVTTKIKNSSQEITKYLEDIGNTSFGGAMEERAKTLDGTIAALGDTWDELFRTVSSNNVGGLIFDSVTLANGVIEDATTLLRAFGAAATGAASDDTGALIAVQGGVATFFETVAVMAAETLYVLKQTGDTMGGVAAGYKAFFSFDFDAVRAIGAEMKANGEAARREIDATTARILSARKDAGIYASYATRNASAATDPRRVDLGGPVGGVPTVPVVPQKPPKPDLSDYDKLIQKLGVDIPKAAAEAEAAQMGYNKAQTEFLALAGSDVWSKFSNTQRATVAALFENKIASEQSAEAAKTLAKANLDAAASREKYITSLATGIDKIKADIAAQQEATERMGLSKEAIAELDASKLEMLATDLELQAIKAMDRNLDQQTYNALKKQAVAYRELAKAKQGAAAKEVALDLEKANADAAQKAQDDWQKASDSINQTLTDALMRGFESGKDFAKNLRDTVINMFKTMVLRPVISAIINPISGALTGAMGLAGAANAGQGGGGLSTVASGASLLGNSAIGMGFSGAWGAGGGLMSTLGAGTSLLGSGAIGSGLGVIAGALGPIAIGIALLSSFIKKSTPHMGGASSYSDAAGLAAGSDLYQTVGFRDSRKYDDAVSTSLTNNVARAIGMALDSTATAFGKTAGYEITTAFADDSSKDGAWGSLIIKQMGKSVLDWRDTQTSDWAPREFADGEAGMKEYLAAAALTARDALSMAIGEVDWARDMLKALGDSPTLEGLAQAVDQINMAAVAVGKMRQNLVGFADATDATISALVKASGGMDSLVASASTYYDRFYSDAEKTANATRDITDALAAVGLQMPQTDAQFRALVESQMALGESGAAAVAALFGVSGAFADLTASAYEAAEAARKNAVDAAYRALQNSVAAQRAQLEIQRGLAQESVSTLSKVFALVSSNARELYNEVASAAAQSAVEGNAFISNALNAARSTGYTPDADALATAIQSARSGLDSGNYATQFDKDSAALELAGKLTALGDITGEQLSTAERTLKAIKDQIDQGDKILAYWKQQIDIASGSYDALLSVGDAIAAIDKLLRPEEEPTPGAASKAPNFSAGPSGGGGGGGSAPSKSESILGFVNDAYSAGSVLDDLRGFAVTASIKGWTQADIASAYGYSKEDIERLFSGAGIPAFAAGTNYVPRDMLAQIHTGEAIIPRAYNPAAGGAAQDGRTAALMEQLIAENRTQAAEIVRINARVAKLLERWDGDGMPAERLETA